MRSLITAVLLSCAIGLCIASDATSQGVESSPYASGALLRRGSISPASNVLASPNSTAGLLPGFGYLPATLQQHKDIPNLQAGIDYFSGKDRWAGYLTLDYILPIRLDASSIVFGTAHSEFQFFSRDSSGRADDQLYLAMGGGYRTILTKRALVGVNCFYDVTRFADRWLSSGGAGLETALLLAGHDALDLNLNWYGDLAGDQFVTNEYRNGSFNVDLQIGYSHQLFDRGPDLRLYATAYKFDDGTGVYGWRAGAELKSPDGVLSVKCETGSDRVNHAYQTVAASASIGFDLGNLLRGSSPFSMPEPLFKSPRNFGRLTDKVKRYWRHTTHGVLFAAQNQTVTIVNRGTKSVKVYMGFEGSYGKYSPADFPGFSVAPSSCNKQGLVMVLNRDLQPGDHVVVSFDPSKGQISPAFSFDRCTWNCTTATPQTLAEFTLQGGNNRDYVDVSLVNGFNYPVRIASSATGSPPVTDISVDSATGNQNKTGVFPLYCDACNESIVPGCMFPANQSECSPDNMCQVNYPAGANYVVSVQPN